MDIRKAGLCTILASSAVIYAWANLDKVYAPHQRIGPEARKEIACQWLEAKALRAKVSNKAYAQMVSYFDEQCWAQKRL